MPDNVLCLLDFGMMGTLSVRYRERLGKLLYFMSKGDEKRTARALLQLIETSEVIDAEILELDVANIIQEFSNAPVGELHVGNIFFKLLRLLAQHRARFPVHLVWLFKSMATLEDISRKMNPEFELVKSARPYARRMILKDLNPLHQSQEFYFTALDSFNLLRDLPYDAGVVIDQLKKGRFKIEFEHVGLEPMRQTLHQITHHIALTMLLAAVLISSSIIVLAGVPPLVGSIPIIGLAGFGISGILTVAVIISLLIR
jgi:ubiquinone biosynthesis protein